MAVPALSDLELATGGMFGLEPGAPVLSPSRREPLEVAGDILQPYLERGSCLVWMTGDHGGTMTLAAAVRRARREGLPDPIVLTLQLEPGAADDPNVAAVVRTLGVREWVRADGAGRLGYLSEEARHGLLRHGVRFPAIGHVVVPLAQAAHGGTVVECHGAREVFDFWRAARLRALFTRRRPGARQALYAFLSVAPEATRRRLIRQRWSTATPGHLRPAAHDWLREQFEAEALAMPLTASAAVLRLHRRRCLWETARTFGELAADHGADVVHPFMDPRAVAAVAGAAGRTGWASIEAMVRDVAPGLPTPRVPRMSIPPHHFWAGETTQAFIESWDGSGLPEDLLHLDRMRDAWRTGAGRSGALLQAAWLASAEAAAERERLARPVGAA